METVYEVVYFSKDGNFYDTNLSFKNKELGIETVDLKVGNWKIFNTESIQLYESVYDTETYERIRTKLIHEVFVN